MVYKKVRAHLPANVRRQVLYLVKDYDRMVSEADGILDESGKPSGGMPRSGSISDTVAAKAAKRERLLQRINAIDEAALMIPKDLRDAVFENVKDGTPLPDLAHPQTYYRWRSIFLYAVAEKLNMI